MKSILGFEYVDMTRNFPIYRSGPFQWRDVKNPKEHLETWCERHNIAKPQYLSSSQLVLDSKIYKLEDFGKF